MPVKGIERVKRGFRIAVKEIGEGKTERAVYETLSQGSAMAAQMTPIDSSNLVNSQYAPQIDVKEGKVSGSVGTRPPMRRLYTKRQESSKGSLGPTSAGRAPAWVLAVAQATATIGTPMRSPNSLPRALIR